MNVIRSLRKRPLMSVARGRYFLLLLPGTRFLSKRNTKPSRACLLLWYLLLVPCRGRRRMIFGAIHGNRHYSEGKSDDA